MALVQVLTYAVEFATRRQFERLEKGLQWPIAFPKLPEPLLDLYVLVADTPDKGILPEIWNSTQELAVGLGREAAIKAFVRRIAFLDVDRSGDGKVVIRKLTTVKT